MEEAITLTPAQVAVVATWSVEGPDMVPVSVYGSAPSFVDSWGDGDVLVTQGDAYVQVSRTGDLKDAVPCMPAELAGPSLKEIELLDSLDDA